MRPCKCYYSYQGNSEPELQYEDTHPFCFNLMQVCHCNLLIPCRYWLPLVLVPGLHHCDGAGRDRSQAHGAHLYAAALMARVVLFL